MKNGTNPVMIYNLKRKLYMVFTGRHESLKSWLSQGWQTEGQIKRIKENRAKRLAAIQ